MSINKMQEIVAAIGRKELRVGYFENARYMDGTQIAGVAATMEFGSQEKSIPPRPTLEPGMWRAKADMSEAVKYASRQVLAGALAPDRALEAAGLVAVDSVRQEIRETFTPPLAKETILRRQARQSQKIASDKPLVDTGQMLRSVAFDIAEAE